MKEGLSKFLFRLLFFQLLKDFKGMVFYFLNDFWFRKHSFHRGTLERKG